MSHDTEFVWNGETNRRLAAYRTCPCGVCSQGRRGVGYLSASDANGTGFTIWVEEEKVFQELRHALRRLMQSVPRRTNCNEGLQNTSPPKPDRIELVKQVRRATIEDQLYLMDWLEMKYAKVRPKK